MPISDVLSEQAFVPYAPAAFSARRVAVLAPHADDEVFGCGAAIASVRSQGAEVFVAVATDGAGEEPDLAARERISSERLAESRAALAALGGAELEAFGLPDRGLLARDRELRDHVRGFLSRRRPDLLFLPSPAEVHPDHRAVARAALALFLEEQVADPPRLAFYEVSQAIRPNFLLDATPFLATKDAAIAAFASQFAGHDYPKVVRGLMAYRSLTLGPAVKAAEAFFVTTVPELRERGLERLLRAVGPSELWS